MKTFLTVQRAVHDRIASLGKRGRIAFGILAALVIVGTIGCLVMIQRLYSEQTPVPGGTLVEGIIGAPRFVNPVFALTSADNDLSNAVFSGLFRLSSDGELVSDLASSFTVSDDGKVYQVLLRDDIYFHDRHAIDAHDVVFTVERIQDPLVASPHQIDWQGVRATMLDRRTVTFTLSEPYAGFPKTLTTGIIPQHIWETIPPEEMALSKYNTDPIGSGPYEVSRIKRTSSGTAKQYTLERFKRHPSDAFLRRIVVKIFANEAAASRALERSNIDALGGIRIEKDSVPGRFETYSATLPRIIGIFVNGSTASALNDPMVRNIVNQAIDRNLLIDIALGGYGTLAEGPLPLTFGMHEEHDHTHPAVPREEIIAFLDEAGWALNETSGLREKNDETLSFTLATSNTLEFQIVAEAIRAQLAGYGIDMGVQIFDPGTFEQDIIRSRSFDAVLFGFAMQHDTDLFAFWHSSERNDPGLNITGYANPRVDRALEEALKENDSDERSARYAAIAQELDQDLPAFFLYSPTYTYYVHKYIKNVDIEGIMTPAGRWNTLPTWYRYTQWVWHVFTR